MIGGLHRFLDELRAAGIRVSPGEWLDAVRAVERLGIDDRERFRLALRCAVAKRAGHRKEFDRLFDRFFAPPARGSKGRERRKEHGGGPGRGLRGEGRSERPRLSSEPSGAPRIQRRLEALRQGERHGRGRLRQVIAVPAEPDRESSRNGRSEEGAWRRLRRDLRARLSPAAERELAEQVPRLVESLRLRCGRRLQRAARGRLYLRRLFRDNLAQDGVPFVLPFRRSRPRRPKVVLLVDVSWSTARAAGLFVSIACEFLLRWRQTRVLFFVDRPVDATLAVEGWMRGRQAGAREARGPGSGIERGGSSFAALLESLPGINLQAPSDYGRAFHALLTSPARPEGRNTVLVILGDGRTNRFDPLDWALEEIRERCGVLLWMVPESLDSWGTGDSALGAYLPHADVAVETRDLQGLARGVAELLRRL